MLYLVLALDVTSATVVCLLLLTCFEICQGNTRLRRLRALIGCVSRAMCSRQQCDERPRGLRIVCCASLSDGRRCLKRRLHLSSFVSQPHIVSIDALRVPMIMLQRARKEKKDANVMPARISAGISSIFKRAEHVACNALEV